MKPRLPLLRATLLGLLLATGCALAAAQPAPPKAAVAKASAARVAARPAPAATGYRFAKAPDWVQPVSAETRAPAGTNSLGYRHLLADTQTLISPDGSPQTYVHMRTAATDSGGLTLLSKVELSFNPAYQTLTVHEVSLYRDGKRGDRLKDARVELLRREESLDRETLTGVRTLLIVMNDVRVGDVVDVAYTVHGSNPIYKGHFSQTYGLAYPVPVDVLHNRIESPAGRALRVRGIRSDLAPESFVENGRQVLRLRQVNVPAVVEEEHTPPWFKVYPVLHVSDYADWQAVATWAQDLFANPGDLGPELSARIEAWRARNLPREQLVSEVLGFVQDEVRYFSASLGESSHRPKPPARTYAERLGDCKDKVALLDAMLKALGLDARPALISVYRNRGIADYLPSHDQFDHVITRLEMDGQVWWLDGTLQKQGRAMKTRGVVPYGMALVADAGTTDLTRLERAGPLADAMEFDQTWNTADLSRPAQFTNVLRAHGLSAERWRQGVASAGAERVAGNLAGVYARVLPGLKSVADPVVRDDREANVFELEMKYELSELGRYDRGSLGVELPVLEVLDQLVGPREARREMPYLLDSPRTVKQRVRIVAPRRFTSNPPAATDVGDRHFSLNARYLLDGSTLDYVLTYERRTDDVAAADLASYRDRIQQARKLGGLSLRLPLLDLSALKDAAREIDRRVYVQLGREADTLRDVVMRQELDRLLATEALKRVADNPALVGRVLHQRAIASSMLDDGQGTLEDTDKVIRIAPDIGYAHYTRGLALLSLGRPQEAAAALRQYKDPDDRGMVDKALGGAQYYSGQFAEAERSFRQTLQDASGDRRLYALAWLYLSAERQGGKGQEAVAAQLDSVDREAWPGVLVLHLAGKASRDDVLREAKRDKGLERLRLAEAYFYLGQRLLLSGKADEARFMFRRMLDSHATPHAEYAYARMELEQAPAR